MALDKELETYQNKLPELDAHEGKFVLIQGETVIGIYAAYEDALKAGYEHCGIDKPFLVKQIRSVEHVQIITRILDLVCRI